MNVILRSLRYFFLLVLTLSNSYALEIGQVAPNCVLTALHDNTPFTLTQPGKVIYIDFWASWCAPCAQSMPFINELYTQYHHKGFEVIGVNLDDNPNDAYKFLEKIQVTFPIVQNSDHQCPDVYGVQAMPSSYLVDRAGKVRFIHFGFYNNQKEDIRQRIEKLIAE